MKKWEPSPELYQAALALRKQDPTIGRYRLARELDVTDTQARILAEALNADAPPQPEAEPPQGQSWDEKDGEAVAETRAIVQVRSLDELLEYFKVDTALWEVTRHIVNQWGKGDHLQVKAWLRRRYEPAVYDPLLELMEEFADRVKPTSRPSARVFPRNPILMVPSPVDHHFGLLAWGKETTGQDWDIKIAEEYFQKAIEHSIDATSHLNVTKAVIPLGHDIFNFDTARGTTVWGTQVDNDTRPAKVFKTVCLACVNMVETLAAAVSDVEIVLVPGNHDVSWSHHLCMFLWAWFRNDERVKVDISPNKRKPYLWEENFLCLVHGDMKKWKDLPLQCAVLWPSMFAAAHNWEILHGHIHHERMTRYASVGSNSGVRLRALPSLVACDYWHYDSGYVGSRRAMITMLYKRAGKRGEIITDVEDVTGVPPVHSTGTIDFGERHL